MRLVDFNANMSAGAAFEEQTPIVAIHGSAGSGKQWRHLSDAMTDRRQVICPDLPGYGGARAAMVPVAAMMDAEAAIIVQQISEFGRPVHLVGHSYGAAVAVKIAMRAPSVLASLTIIEPAMFHVLDQGAAGDRKLHQQITSVAGMVSAAIAEGSPGAGMERFVDFWNGRGAYQNLSTAMQGALAAQIGQVAANFATAMAQKWQLEACREISCPTMAIMGLESRLVAQRTTEMIAESIPDMQLAMISDAGHMSPFTHSAIVNRLIGGHIAAAERGASQIPMQKAA